MFYSWQFFDETAAGTDDQPIIGDLSVISKQRASAIL